MIDKIAGLARVLAVLLAIPPPYGSPCAGGAASFRQGGATDPKGLSCPPRTTGRRAKRDGGTPRRSSGGG